MSDWKGLRSFQDQLDRKVESHTVALFGEYDNYPSPGGTGVLLQIADRHFILSAGHVMAINTDEGIPFRVVSGGRLRRLDEGKIMRTRSGEDHKDLDAAVATVNSTLAGSISESYTFLRLSDLDLHDPVTPASRYWLQGYPSELRWPDMEQTGCHSKCFVSVPSPGNNWQRVGMGLRTLNSTRRAYLERTAMRSAGHIRMVSADAASGVSPRVIGPRIGKSKT